MWQQLGHRAQRHQAAAVLDNKGRGELYDVAADTRLAAAVFKFGFDIGKTQAVFRLSQSARHLPQSLQYAAQVGVFLATNIEDVHRKIRLWKKDRQLSAARSREGCDDQGQSRDQERCKSQISAGFIPRHR